MRIAIIDALNVLFLRNYLVNPALALNGEPIGGIVGSFKSLQKLCNELNPDKVIIAWDGEGGSTRRKQQNKNYKSGRSPIRFNRTVNPLTPDEDEMNRYWQHARLFEFLNYLPVSQILVKSVEADDIIAEIVKKTKGNERIIVSSDKDFIQLLDDSVVLYRPIQKEILTVNNVPEKYGIHPNNFTLARAAVGDKSDALDGIRGVGLKTIAKRLPFLKESKTYLLSDVVDYCKKTESKVKFYDSIVKNKDLMLKNIRIMQLDNPLLTTEARKVIREVLNTKETVFEETNLKLDMMEMGWFSSINWNPLMARMRLIVSNNLK